MKDTFNYMVSICNMIDETQKISFVIDSEDTKTGYCKETNRFTVSPKAWAKIKNILIKENNQ